LLSTGFAAFDAESCYGQLVSLIATVSARREQFEGSKLKEERWGRRNLIEIEAKSRARVKNTLAGEGLKQKEERTGWSGMGVTYYSYPDISGGPVRRGGDF
jgi:hypothetical protein